MTDSDRPCRINLYDIILGQINKKVDGHDAKSGSEKKYIATNYRFKNKRSHARGFRSGNYGRQIPHGVSRQRRRFPCFKY